MMVKPLPFNLTHTVLVIALVIFGAISAVGQKPAAGTNRNLSLAPVKPESVGFSSRRLENLHALMQQMVDQKKVAGAVTLLARHGKVVDYRTYGQRDMASAAPMTRDDIFRIFSMTKPITGVAMMILYEQGKWLPSDPISKFIPEFAHLKVYKGVDGNGNMILEDPVHPPTIHELMTHTAGFTYGIFGNTPVDQMYMKAVPLRSNSLKEMIDKLAQLPLLYQPGSRWVYSMSTDIQGYIVEKLSGQSFPDFLEQNIFKPLGMKDTGFMVPAGKRDRFATLYRADAKGNLEVEDSPIYGRPYDVMPGAPSGGGGLVSTTEDYFRFAQMLANGGELNGVRILSPASVRLMASNHLPPKLLMGEWGIGMTTFRSGFGFGYDCAVVFNPPDADLPEGQGSLFWGGAAGTWFWVDPTNDLVFVGLIQRLFGPLSPPLDMQSRSIVYGALVNPKM